MKTLFWSQLPFLPILIPILFALLQGVAARYASKQSFIISLIGAVLLVMVSAAQAWQAFVVQQTQVYEMGSWMPPYGIVLVQDAFAVWFLCLASLVNLGALLYTNPAMLERGRYFFVCWQVQLIGINAAFLTADLFNLFVCFELLLIASYALVLHDAGAEKIRVAWQYVLVNLVGAGFFLIGASLCYGVLGTLNFADLAVRLAQASPEQFVLLKTAALALLCVFLLKAAAVPLHYGLAPTYRAANAPVAALFVLLSKVGVYAFLRVFLGVFAAQPIILQSVLEWLLPTFALSSLLGGAWFAFGARRWRDFVSATLLCSTGTLLLASVDYFSQANLEATRLGNGLYYLGSATFAAALGYLLAEDLQQQRGHDGLCAAPALSSGCKAALILALFVLIGVPPSGSFFAKIGLLQTLFAQHLGLSIAFLISAILLLFAGIRVGSHVIWNNKGKLSTAPLPPIYPVSRRLARYYFVFLLCLVVWFAAPLLRFSVHSAESLLNRSESIDMVLRGGLRPVLDDAQGGE